jgi:hypothetical protein
LDVRFAPDSDRTADMPKRPFSANTGLMHCSKIFADTNGSILVASSLRDHLSGMTFPEQLASDDVLNTASRVRTCLNSTEFK